MHKLKYPLEQVLAVKKDRVEKSEKVFKEKQKALEIEQDKLKKAEAERDAVLNHHNDKLAQLRKALDEGTTSDEVLQMKAYLKVVKEKVAKEEVKVKQQKEQVSLAEKNLEAAKIDLQKKRIEEEKIKIHKEQWEKEALAQKIIEDTKEHDELGNTIHQIQKRKKE